MLAIAFDPCTFSRDLGCEDAGVDPGVGCFEEIGVFVTEVDSLGGRFFEGAVKGGAEVRGEVADEAFVDAKVFFRGADADVDDCVV